MLRSFKPQCCKRKPAAARCWVAVRCVSTLGVVAGLVIALGSRVFADSGVLESVDVEILATPVDAAPLDAIDGVAESEVTSQQDNSTMDPIEIELRLQRAIAQSIRGDRDSALNLLEDDRIEDTASLYARAVLLLEKGELESGAELLERITTRNDCPIEAYKFLAVANLHLDRPLATEAAADKFLQHQQDEYVHYVRGLAILRQDDPDRAAAALYEAGYDDHDVQQIQQVVMQFPADVTQRTLTIDSTVNNARRRSSRSLSEERNYNFTVLFAGEYDSNVPLQPRFTGLGSNIDHEDFRFTMATFLDVQLLTSQEYNWGLVGSTYNTFQADADEFNVQDYMGGMYLNGLLTDRLIGSVRHEYHHTLIDEAFFASEHRLTPSLTLLGDAGHTTLFYEFNPIDSDAPALIPAQFQSADIHRLGLTHAIYTFGGDGRVYAGYQYADADSDGSDFDRMSHMVTGRIERPLRNRWIADLDARYVWDDYAHPNSLDFFDRARDDQRFELRTGLQKNFCSPVSLRFDYTYIDNDSNTENLFGVRFYDYDRHIFSSQLIFSL